MKKEVWRLERNHPFFPWRYSTKVQGYAVSLGVFNESSRKCSQSFWICSVNYSWWMKSLVLFATLGVGDFLQNFSMGFLCPNHYNILHTMLRMMASLKLRHKQHSDLNCKFKKREKEKLYSEQTCTCPQEATCKGAGSISITSIILFGCKL